MKEQKEFLKSLAIGSVVLVIDAESGQHVQQVTKITTKKIVVDSIAYSPRTERKLGNPTGGIYPVPATYNFDNALTS